MLFFMVFLIICKVTLVTNKNAGSAIFNHAQIELKCWNSDDVAKLRARKVFEDLIPPSVKPEKINSQYVKEILKYFRNALIAVQQGIDPHTGAILKEALSDTIGAHLNSDILPNVRFAYYAGYIPYRNARKIHNFFEKIKTDLNTQGVGWKRPAKGSQWSNLTVVRILIGTAKILDPCDCLVIKRDANNCIHLPSPKLDDLHEPSAIALPFKTDELVSLMSPKSENILLKYYTTVSRCILDSSPTTCRHGDFVNFNNQLWHWMKREVAPHLLDEKLYTAYGGVLRIAAAVQNYGKGLSRRNLFEFKEPFPEEGWHPWRKLTDSYIYINADWTPGLYVSLVMLTALAIYLLQFCYNYMFGDSNACTCRSVIKKSHSKDIAYSRIDSNFPAMLPQQQSEIFYSTQKRLRRYGKSKSSSLGSLRTQRVYDLNENAEKMMAVILSSNEDSEMESTSSKPDSDEECEQKPGMPEIRSRSPPKIETTIAQLKIEKSQTPRSEKRVAIPMYSTSTRSDVTFCQPLQMSDSAWSATSTSTSGKSASSRSSKSHTQRTRSSRDLAWARHVISRHSRTSRRGAQSSGTELEIQSFMTPPSRR